MDADRLRTWLLTLPHVAETMQWGANLVFWAGGRSPAGKMFCVIDLDDPHSGAVNSGRKPRPVVAYATTPDRYAELLEIEGLVPAPYLARAHWIAALHWDVFTSAEWRRELAAAHALVLTRLPAKTRRVLGLPPRGRPYRAFRTSTSVE